MSILDGLFTNKETLQGAVAFAQNMTRETLPNLNEEARRIIELTTDGSSLGDVLGITRHQKAALLDMGCRLIQLQQLEKATDVLMRLNQLDPLEERALYALGVVCQMRNEWYKAAQMYLQFLALDATNPIGYLRLGECLLAVKEYAEAYSAFVIAKEFADEGKGQPGNADEARKMLAVPEIAAAGAAIRQ